MTAELVVAFPLLLILVFSVVQFALYEHAAEPKQLVFLEDSGHTEWMLDDHATFQRMVGLLDDFFRAALTTPVTQALTPDP